MPRVNIREIDNTGLEQTTYVENLALIPGVKLEGYDADGNLVTLDGEYETLDAFKNQVVAVFGCLEADMPEAEESGEETWYDKLNALKTCYIQDKGFAMAFIALSYGLPVQYAGAYDVEITTISESGQDPKVTVEPKIDLNEIKTLYKDFADRGKYDMKMVAAPFIDVDEEDKNKEDLLIDLIKVAITCAGDRGDAYALVYAPNYVTESADVDAWINGNDIKQLCSTEIERPAVSWSARETTEQYGSYSSNVTANITVTYTIESPFSFILNNKTVSPKYKFNKATFPGFLDYLACFAKSTKSNPDYYAIAGSTRGSSPLASWAPLAKYGDADVDILQVRDGGLNDVNKGHIASNPIAFIRPYGNIIWGNRTMHPLSAPNNGFSTKVQLLASDFLNIRNLCCDIKKTIYRASRRFTFDPNSDTLWFNYKAAITPLLEKMKTTDGIRDYQIVKVATTKKALLASRIIISPIEAVEDFDITIELTDAIQVS